MGKFTMVSLTRSAVTVMGLLLLLGISWAAAGLSEAQDLFAGNIKSLESDDPSELVKIIRPGYNGILMGKPGDAVFVGDTIKTSERLKAQIVLSDGTVINLGHHATTQIKGYQVDRAQAKRNAVLKTFEGMVRFVVAKMFRPHPAGSEMNWKDSTVTIETSNAVAGVRGTDFVVVAAKEDTEIAVLEGSVSFRSSSPSLKGEVILGENQFSSIARNGFPAPAAALPPQRRDTLTRSTTLVNPRTSSNGTAPQNGKKDGKDYGSKDLAREIASGTPLEECMDKALESGMTIEAIVATAVLEAGVDASTVVYTCAVEGYPINQVVEAAIESGVPLNVVVSSALAGGGDKKLIIVGAQDAGAPPAAVANSFAAAGSPTAPISGGTTYVAASPTPVTIAPSTPISPGGGGGAPPSTQPASRYK